MEEITSRDKKRISHYDGIVERIKKEYAVMRETAKDIQQDMEDVQKSLKDKDELSRWHLARAEAAFNEKLEEMMGERLEMEVERQVAERMVAKSPFAYHLDCVITTLEKHNVKPTDEIIIETLSCVSYYKWKTGK